LDELRAQAGKTDWDRVVRTTDEEIAQDVAQDPDLAPLLDEAWFEGAEVVEPAKEQISIRLDREVLDYFRGTGRRYQTRINAVLKAYVEAQRRKAG
jgi:uncharacterized protein (DUF4415 family)